MRHPTERLVTHVLLVDGWHEVRWTDENEWASSFRVIEAAWGASSHDFEFVVRSRLDDTMPKAGTVRGPLSSLLAVRFADDAEKQHRDTNQGESA